MGDATGGGNRWRSRPILASLVGIGVVAIPVVCSVAAAGLVGYLWGPTAAPGGTIMRWVVILGTSTVVFIAGERIARRALPLSVLLKMGMVFPGRAPKRFSVARRTWTTRDLSRRIEDARHHGISDEPTLAAEQIVALAATLSAHDRKTRGHAERVRAFTDLIAEELRLPDDDRDRLRWSALLHDVGKLTVHADILNKPGTLSDDEWELMRQHPLEGAKLTAPLAAWLGPWANTIAEHHERFDGRGYPFGLAGQEISVGGRIVAVADCYDTMTSLRSYKKPMSAEAARAELAACAGTHFDPVMVRAFLGVSVSRLHAVAPLSWIGSLPFGNLGPQFAQLAATGGRVAVTGLVATVGVVGLTAGGRTVTPTAPTYLSAQSRSISPASPGTRSAASATGTGRAGPAGRTGSSPNQASASRPGHGGDSGPFSSGSDGEPTTTEPGRSAGADPDGASGSNGQSSGDGSGGDASGAVGSNGGAGVTPTTAAPGSTPPVPPTTVASPGATTTTTTTAPLPPLVGPSGLTATGGCQALILAPEATLKWTASPTTRVTGYVILRSTTKTGAYSTVGSVSGRTTVTDTDKTVQGLSATYWYEVEAVAGGATATTGPVSVTMPVLCL